MKFITLRESTQDTKAIRGYGFFEKASIDKTARPDYDENDHDYALDSFYDGWGDLCRGEDGDLYCVEFYEGKPYIWARIK